MDSMKEKNPYISVKETCPKAWSKFVEWQFINGSKYVKSPNDFLAQDFDWQKGILYNFFDEQLINILITCEFDFGFEILEKRYEEIESVRKWYSDRKEAEEEAFKYAFAILENKLTP